MENAVIGVFDDFQHARDAADALVGAGFREWAVQITPKEETHAARETALDDHARYESSQGWSIGNFFRTLFGMDAEHEHAHGYAEALRRGSFLVTVEAEGEGPMEQAREIMSQFHPIDMEERAAHWRSQGWSRFETGSKAYTDEQVQSERSAYQTMTGGGQRGNANVRSFKPVDQGAAPGGGSEMGGMTGVTGSPAQGTPVQHAYQAAADVGGGAGFGAAQGMRSPSDAGTDADLGASTDRASGATPAGSSGTGTGFTSTTGVGIGASGVGATAAEAARAAADSFGASESRPSGSGGTLGSLGAGNADLHESTGTSGTVGDIGTAGLGGAGASQSLGSEERDPLMGNAPGTSAGVAAGSLPSASDRIQEEVMGGESLGRDTMGGDRPGIVREAMGAGSGSGDPSSLPAGSQADTARQSEAVYDQGLGRQTAATRHAPADETSGIMENATMRDSTAPDIYTVDHDADYRTHWQKTYGMEGRYEDFEPAYRFGADLHRNDALKDYHSWNEIEPEARRHWEAGSGSVEGTWDKAKDAVRHAWERMKE